MLPKFDLDQVKTSHNVYFGQHLEEDGVGVGGSFMLTYRPGSSSSSFYFSIIFCSVPCDFIFPLFSVLCDAMFDSKL